MLKWLDWAQQLGGAKNHEALFVVGCEITDDQHAKINEAALKVYGKTSAIKTFYRDPRPWPVNANLAFQRAVRHIDEHIKTPFMWCEVDCVPLKPGWWDAWEAEYKACGKPFMGFVVREPFHLSGNAVYPPNFCKYTPHPLLCEEVAWDVVDSAKVLPHTHHTKLYHHQWFYGVPPQPVGTYSAEATHFATLDDLRIISQDAVLFHRNKDGSLIDRLRERDFHNFDQDVVPIKEVKEPIQLKMPIRCGIFIRTYRGDAPWLPLCLASLKKYGVGFHRILVVAPEMDKEFIKPKCDKAGVEFLAIENDYCDGYIAQQITKLKADTYMPDCEYILHIDSDTLFYRRLTPLDMMASPTDLRPEILIEPYSAFSGTKMPWQGPTEEAIGQPVQYEFMRRHPFCYPAWIYPLAREHLQKRFNRTWDSYISSKDPAKGTTFSEFNFLGAFAYLFHNDKFVWRPVDKRNLPLTKVKEFRSWDGITDKVMEEIKKILDGKYATKACVEKELHLA